MTLRESMPALVLLFLGVPAFGQVAEGPPPMPKLERPFQPPALEPPRPQPAAAQPAADSQQPKVFVAARVLARVNGQPILLEEVMNASAMELETVRPQVPEAQWPMVREEFMQRKLDEMVTVEVLLQDAGQRVAPKVLAGVLESGGKEFDKKFKLFRDKLKYPTEEAATRELVRAGYTVDEMRRQFARSVVAFEYLRNLIKDSLDLIDREEMLAYYRANAKDFEKPELFTWQHLYLDAGRFPSRADARRQAEQLQQLMLSLRRREDFHPLAQKYSHSPDRYNNGENVDPPGQIRPPEVLNVLLQMVPGQTSAVIEVPSGFHIVKLLEHQKAGLIPFEVACQDIKLKLQQKKWQEEYDKVVKRLRAKATIENLSKE